MPSARDIAADYADTQARIANLPCSDSSYIAALKELARWNNPGQDLEQVVARFVSAKNLALPRPQYHNHPTIVLIRAIKNLFNQTDTYKLDKDHWDELDIPGRWHNYPKWHILTNEQVQHNDRPLWKALQKCRVNPDRVLVGIPNFQHGAVYEVVNRLQTLTHHPASPVDVERIIGKSNVLRPLRQTGVPWRSFTTSDSRMTVLWTMAVAGSMWGLEFVDSFLEFCTAALVGSICAVSREECKEGFAACIAVATIARARPISAEELRSCTTVWWIVDIIEKACGSAQNTLFASRYITKVNGKRSPTSACDKWETPIDPRASPVNTFYVIGKGCTDPQNANQDGSFGASCPGRFLLATKIEDFGEQNMRDGAMRVALVHNNPQAAQNILAVLERRGIWAYVQGPKECLTCAYRAAMRHGFAVIIDGPHEAENATTCIQAVSKSTVRRTNSSVGSLRTFAWLLTLYTGLCLNQVASITVPLSGDHPPYFQPNATCEHLTQGPIRAATSWSRLFGIVRGLQSVIFTVIAIRSGKRYVSRSIFGLITAVLSTLMSGFSGWILINACAQYKAMAIMKGLVTAAVNRFAYETIDVLCMVVSLSGLLFGFLFPLFQANFWELLQPVPLALICMSASYIWRWYKTGKRMSTSRGVVGEPVSLLGSHIVALALAVVAFVFTTEQDSTASAASYVTDGLMMGEVLLQFLFLE